MAGGNDSLWKQAGSGGTLAGEAALFSAFALKNRMEGLSAAQTRQGRCPLHPAKGLRPFRNPFWGTLAGGAALFSAFALKNRMRGTGRSPDPAGALPTAPREGTSSLSKPILGYSCGWSGSFQRFCAEKSHEWDWAQPRPGRGAAHYTPRRDFVPFETHFRRREEFFRC